LRWHSQRHHGDRRYSQHDSRAFKTNHLHSLKKCKTDVANLAIPSPRAIHKTPFLHQTSNRHHYASLTFSKEKAASQIGKRLF
jgi:hypothetical protein